jgi:SAM-dependent methyltransferase
VSPSLPVARRRRTTPLLRAATFALVASAAIATGATAPAPAAGQAPAYQPEVGQPGKDVVWVPTPEEIVDRMLTMAQVGRGDVVYDLGSGDGRTVIAAARRGARAVGVEYEAGLVALSRRNAEREGVSPDAARFVQADLFETDFSSATVVTLYLLQELNLRLRPTLLGMRPGTRIVSNRFDLGDWEPDEVSLYGIQPVRLWFVPARVEGKWQVTFEGGRTFELELRQSFQRVEGSVGLGIVRAGLREARLRGDAIAFSFVDGDGVLRELAGTVSGGRMEGTVRAATATTRFAATLLATPPPPPLF